MSDSTRHHNAVALERLQKFALDHNFLDKPVFGKLEKPRVGLSMQVVPLWKPDASELFAQRATSRRPTRLYVNH
jgi:hypothetical protein